MAAIRPSRFPRPIRSTGTWKYSLMEAVEAVVAVAEEEEEAAD